MLIIKENYVALCLQVQTVVHYRIEVIWDPIICYNIPVHTVIKISIFLSESMIV
jgi:hypothetical protein